MIFTVDAVAGIKKAWEFGPLTRINCHVSSSTVPAPQERKPFVVRNNQKETKFASGWYQTEDWNFIGLGSPSGWLELTMGSFLETCYRVEGRERVERSGMTRSRGRSILWTRISICVLSFVFDKRWTDYTCCFFEIINLDLGDWRKTFSLEQTWSRSIDLQKYRLHLYYWNCEFRSWWLERDF